MGRRREKARQTKKRKDEGPSNPSNVQQAQRNICSHCGQIIDARRLKFKDVCQDSGISKST